MRLARKHTNVTITLANYTRAVAKHHMPETSAQQSHCVLRISAKEKDISVYTAKLNQFLVFQKAAFLDSNKSVCSIQTSINRTEWKSHPIQTGHRGWRYHYLTGYIQKPSQCKIMQVWKFLSASPEKNNKSNWTVLRTLCLQNEDSLTTSLYGSNVLKTNFLGLPIIIALNLAITLKAFTDVSEQDIPKQLQFSLLFKGLGNLGEEYHIQHKSEAKTFAIAVATLLDMCHCHYGTKYRQSKTEWNFRGNFISRPANTMVCRHSGCT